ncbi:hypothetical protein B7463_g4834, partial [Scytalidium lignicola]
MIDSSFLKNGRLSASSAIAVVTLCLFVWISAVGIYRLTFHPLARYPGPLLARLTAFYDTYHAWKGDRHLEFWRCHEKYGPVYRYGPNSLSFNTNTALKTIYGHRANVQKSQFYSVFPPTKDTFNTHSSINKMAHARKRRVLSHAFSDSALKTMEKYVLANIRLFCSKLEDKPSPFGGAMEKSLNTEGGWSSPRNMAKWCNYLTFDVMGDLCFGKAFEMLDREENRHVTDLLGNAAHMHLIMGTNPLIKEWGLNKILFRKIYNDRMKYMAYSKAQATERSKIGLDTDRKDFFYYLLNARDPETGKGFTQAELWGESNLLIIAGSDTTSTALAGTLFYLTHYPEKQEKLSREILSTFQDVEEIVSGATLTGCTYLRAVIDETMRLSPPVGALLPREVLSGGIDIDGLHIPAGSVVGTPHYAIHHNADYYPDPFNFKPERWIPDSEPGVTRDSVDLVQSAFCPFSIGSRGCIGKGLAYAELTETLARVIFQYEMRKAPGMTTGEGSPDLEWGRQRKDEFQLRDSFTKQSGSRVWKDGWAAWAFSLEMKQWRQRKQKGKMEREGDTDAGTDTGTDEKEIKEREGGEKEKRAERSFGTLKRTEIQIQIRSCTGDHVQADHLHPHRRQPKGTSFLIQDQRPKTKTGLKLLSSSGSVHWIRVITVSRIATAALQNGTQRNKRMHKHKHKHMQMQMQMQMRMHQAPKARQSTHPPSKEQKTVLYVRKERSSPNSSSPPLHSGMGLGLGRWGSPFSDRTSRQPDLVNPPPSPFPSALSLVVVRRTVRCHTLQLHRGPTRPTP